MTAPASIPASTPASTPAPRILGIVGSLRNGSFNRTVAEEAAAIIAAKGGTLELLDWSEIPVFNQDIEFPAPESVKRARAAVTAADGLYFFTPEYNRSIPGGLKNLIDWLSRPIDADTPHVLNTKKMAVAGLSVGMSGTLLAQEHLYSVLAFLGGNIMQWPRLTIANAMNQLEGGKLVLTSSKPFVAEQARAFADFCA